MNDVLQRAKTEREAKEKEKEADKIMKQLHEKCLKDPMMSGCVFILGEKVW